MYKVGAIGAGATAATLPVTGLSLGWDIVLGATILVAGIAFLRLAPKIGRKPVK